MKKIILPISLILLFNQFVVSSSNINIKKYHKKGMRLYKQRRYHAALRYFKKILTIDKNKHDALYNCACMNALLKKLDNTLFFLTKLLFINPKWKVKLLPNVESDFRYIKYNPRFILYSRFFLQKNNGLNNINYLLGEYSGAKTGKDFEGGATVTTYTINIKPGGSDYYFSVNVSPALGNFLYSKIIKITNYRNLYLLKLNEDKVTPYKIGFVELKLLADGRALISFPFYNRNDKAPWDISNRVTGFHIPKDIKNDIFLLNRK